MPGLVAFEDMMQDSGAPRLRQELGVKADKRACGHKVFLAHPAGPVVDHMLEAALAQGDELSNDAKIVLRDIDRQPFHWLAEFPVDHLRDDLWLADGKLKTLAAHRLNEDRQLELTPALHLPCVRPVRRTHPD